MANWLMICLHHFQGAECPSRSFLLSPSSLSSAGASGFLQLDLFWGVELYLGRFSNPHRLEFCFYSGFILKSVACKSLMSHANEDTNKERIDQTWKYIALFRDVRRVQKPIDLIKRSESKVE